MNTLEASKASDQKYCHACAKLLHTSASFCPSCGAHQMQSVAVPPAASSAPVQEMPAQRMTADQCHCHGCGTIIHVSAPTCPRCGAQQRNAGTHASPSAQRSRVTAGLLALFLGGFGAHKFYCGKTGIGFLYLLFFWTWIPSIVAFVEAIIYFANTTDQEFNQKYCV